MWTKFSTLKLPHLLLKPNAGVVWHKILCWSKKGFKASAVLIPVKSMLIDECVVQSQNTHRRVWHSDAVTNGDVTNADILGSK